MPPLTIERLATFAMGTRFELILTGDDPGRLRSVGEAAIEQIEDLDQRWSLFRRDSLLSFINRHAPDRPVRVDGDSFQVLSIAERVRSESGGLFDVAVAPAMRRWGFHTASDPEAERSLRSEASDTPSPRVILGHGDQTVRFASAAVAIDLGGIAKGYAVDLAMRILREHDIRCAIVHGGTSCIGAIGAPPAGDGWRIALENPARGERPVVTLRDSCLAMSSPTGREVEVGGRRLGHIIDPRTGAPAPCARVACVIGPSAALCDAWCKPVLIARGRPEGLPDDSTTVVDSARDGSARWVVDGPDAPRVLVPRTDSDRRTQRAEGPEASSVAAATLLSLGARGHEHPGAGLLR